MKYILSALIAASTLAIMAPAFAGPVQQTCTTEYAVSKDAPVGKYVDKNGRTWVGFKADGTPPDSLSSAVNSTTCTESAAQVPAQPPQQGGGPL